MSVDETKRRLITERDRLLIQIGRIEEDFALPMDDDLAEQAVEREDDEVLDGEERIAMMRIRAINAALDRLHAGVYGICITCGQPISPRRLAAIPETATCIRCAATTGAAAAP